MLKNLAELTLKSILILLLISFCVGCGSFKEWRYLPSSQDDEHSIFVVSHGWHTGVVIPSQSVESELSFLKREFSKVKFYEFGWGDKGFYQASEVNFGLVLEAIFWPSDSVMHVAGLTTMPQDYFPQSELLEVNISSEGLEHLLNAISESFMRDREGWAITSGKGLYGQGVFYQGKEKYFITNNCNTWVAKILDQAGVPISSYLTWTAGSVMSQTGAAVDDYSCCP